MVVYKSLFCCVILVWGRAEWSKQRSDSHWLRLTESPINMIFFPLNFSKKYRPLNLQQHLTHISFNNQGQKQSIRLRENCDRDTKQRKFITLASRNHSVAICTWGMRDRDDHTLGNRTLCECKGKSKSRREDTNRRKSSFLGTCHTCSSLSIS